MDLDLKGKVALVTAASQGLGYACALRLAASGCRVAICARRPDPLERARVSIAGETGTTVFAQPADVTDADALARFTSAAHHALGSIDIVIANTGHAPYGGLAELNEAQWREGHDLLLMSAVRLARLTVPIMLAQGGGDLLFITSATVREPSPTLLLSNVYRVGVVALAKTLAKTHAADNIRVNTLGPGYFDTGRVRRRIDALVENGSSRADATKAVAGDVPLGRIGDADELANLAAFVVSRKAAFLTGAMISIDGGRGGFLF